MEKENKGKGLITWLAAERANIPTDEVTPEMREAIKILLFPYMYGKADIEMSQLFGKQEVKKFDDPVENERKNK